MVTIIEPETSKQYKNLCKQLPDLERHLKDDEIKIIPIPANSKAPKTKGWNTREYTLEEIQNHTGNYGILIGYNNQQVGYSIAVIDIDGYTLDTDDENEKAITKAETQTYIYEALKDLPNSLQVQTQSGGYHIYLWTKKVEPSTSKTSHSLSFPPDFPIQSLAGKPINDSIEIFTNEGKKQCILPSSTILNKATNQIREYQVISTVNKFSDIDITDDINQTVINHLTSKGYTYQPEPVTVPSNKKGKQLKRKRQSTQEDKLTNLKKSEIKEIVQLVTPIFPIIDGKKHDGAMYLGGYFSYHISKKSAVKICNGIVKEIGNIFKDSQAFKKTVLENYTRQVNKGGLPKLSELILSYDKDFNISKFSDKLNSICNTSFTKELVSSVMVNENQIPIYIYEDSTTKWLKYENIFTNLDLILNLNTLIGSFRNSKTDKEVTSFTFKFKNKSFDLQKKDLESINYFLSTVNKELKLPKYFTEIIRTSINNLDSYTTNPKELSKEVQLKQLFDSRNKESYARKELGNYLYEHGTILRKGINKPYILNESTNGYDSVEIDDILDFLNSTGDFTLNSISTDDIKTALTFIGDRRKPTYNIVKFKNCLYDMVNFTVIENTDEPILTLTEVLYNYNPEAKGKLVVEFLETSLYQRGDTPEKVQERVQGVYEMIGYLLTSGNKKYAWFIFTGIGGAGKGVLTRLIISIFGTDKVGDLKLQELTPDNKFATAHLESKQINIVRDSPKKPIEDTGMLKAITGYDDIGIEPKGKDKYILPKEEVPDMITVCNNIPRFKEGFDESILQRAIIFEFLNKFRGTDNENDNLEEEILSNPEEMEYLLYQSIEAYKDMVQNGRNFQARIDEAKTMELLGKHTDPVSYILPRLVKFNSRAEEDGEDYIITDELNKLILYIGKKEGLNITGLGKDGLIKPINLIGAIKREFNFDKDYKTVPKALDYNTVTKKYEYKRVYPMLCKTSEYDEYLEEMENEETE